MRRTTTNAGSSKTSPRQLWWTGAAGALVGLLLALGGSVAPAQNTSSAPAAAPGDGVFWTEDFENHLMPNWDTSACCYGKPGQKPPIDGCNPAISTDRATSGTHSLKSHFADQNVQGGTYCSRGTPATNDVWMRFYYYTDKFTYNPVVTKHFFNIASKGGLSVIWVNMWGSREMCVAVNHPQVVRCPNGKDGITCNYPPNLAHVPLKDGQWYCIETHVNSGTAGAADGCLELFVDGVQTLGYYKLLMKNKDVGFDVVRHYAQMGLGDRYIDDLVVGKTRIGPSKKSSPPPSSDTRAPYAAQAVDPAGKGDAKSADGNTKGTHKATPSPWPHEPAGSRLLTESDMSELSGNGWNTNPGNRSIVDDPTAPFSPAKVLECRRNSNETGGTTYYYGSFDKKTPDLYIGFWWKPSKPFHGWNVGNQKIMYMMMYNATLDLGMAGPQGGPFTLRFGHQSGVIENGHVPDPNSEKWNSAKNSPKSFSFPGNSLPIELGAWHRMEVYIKRSTTATSRDGTFRVWMDGQLGGEALNINTGSFFEQFEFVQAWDSKIWLPQQEWHRFDHVRLSVPNGAPDPMLPPQPAAGRQAEPRQTAAGRRAASKLGIAGDKFTLDGRETFLLGASYFDALGWNNADLDALQARRFNLIRIFLDWSILTIKDGVLSPRAPRGFINADGSLKNTESLLNLIRACAARGIVVDVTVLNAIYDAANPTSKTLDMPSRENAVRNAVRLLKHEPNVFFDVCNEHEVAWNGKTTTLTHAEAAVLIRAALAEHPGAIVTVSSGGDHLPDARNTREELEAGAMLSAPHFQRTLDWFDRTDERVTAVKKDIRLTGRNVPVYLQEEQRRGWTKVSPPKSEFLQAAREAVGSGAAGWVFHTHAGFDLRSSTFLGNLDSVEREVLDALGAQVFGTPPPPPGESGGRLRKPE